MSGRLHPRDGRVYVVRWVRTDGRDVKHRFYLRRHDALARAERLRRWGKDVAVYESPVAWQEATP